MCPGGLCPTDTFRHKFSFSVEGVGVSKQSGSIISIQAASAPLTFSERSVKFLLRPHATFVFSCAHTPADSHFIFSFCHIYKQVSLSVYIYIYIHTLVRSLC